MDHVCRCTLEREEEAIKQRDKKQLSFMKMCHYADKVLTVNGNQDVSKCNCKDEIITYLKPLKKKDDSKFPSL